MILRFKKARRLLNASNLFKRGLYMNIGIFTDTYYPHVNGVATSIKMLEQQLTKRGHKVFVFTTSNPKVKESNPYVFRLKSMPFIFLPTYRLALFYPPKLLLMIKKFKLDVIHTQTEFSIGIFGKIVSEFFKIPMVHTYHTMYEDYVHYIAKGHLITPKMAQKFSRIFCNRAKIVIAPTYKTEQSLLSYGVVRPITIIPTGLPLDKFKTKRQFNSEKFTILSLGRVAKEKSIDVVIKQMPNVLKFIPNAKLIIVGDGPYLSVLQNLVHDLNLAEHIEFTGEVEWDSIVEYYKLGDVFISASTSETQGLTYIEAMASGLPVVAKNDLSIKNLITHEKTGYVFDNPNEIAQILYDIKKQPAKVQQVVCNALDSIKSLSADEFGNSIEKTYIEAMNS